TRAVLRVPLDGDGARPRRVHCCCCAVAGGGCFERRRRLARLTYGSTGQGSSTPVPTNPHAATTHCRVVFPPPARTPGLALLVPPADSRHRRLPTNFVVVLSVPVGPAARSRGTRHTPVLRTDRMCVPFAARGAVTVQAARLWK